MEIWINERESSYDFSKIFLSQRSLFNRLFWHLDRSYCGYVVPHPVSAGRFSAAGEVEDCTTRI